MSASITLYAACASDRAIPFPIPCGCTGHQGDRAFRRKRFAFHFVVPRQQFLDFLARIVIEFIRTSMIE